MIKIGVVNIDVSHPKAFAEYLAKDSRARYTAVYNDGFRGDDEVEGFISKYGLERRCRSIDELAECVDIGFIQSCNWGRHLEQAMPFLKRGKPVFIDKPVAGSLADCLTFEKLAEEGAVILGSSSVRYSEEITGFMNTPESERGRILNIFGTSGVDEFSYGIHVVEGIGGMTGTGAVSCRFSGFSEYGGKRCETYFIRFENGITAIYNTFHKLWQPFEYVITTDKSTFHFRVSTETRLYGALLDRICEYMETGINKLAPVGEITESVKIMLAGRISREKGGVEVKLTEIPGNDPGFDGDRFEAEYAAAASKIYL